MTIHLLFACDDAYWPILHTAVASLCRTNRDNDVNIHLLCNDLGDEGRVALARLCENAGKTLHLYDVSGASIEHLPTLEYISHTTYCRLLADTLLPCDVRKVIYCDCDVLFRRDIRELYETDVEGVALAGVGEQPGKHNSRLGLPAQRRYFNAGVLLINLDYWRARQTGASALACLARSHATLRLLDQDALNLLIGEDWHAVPPIWNYISEQNRSDPCTDPAIVHFAGPNKPWDYFSSSPFKDEYRAHIPPEIGGMIIDRDYDLISALLSRALKIMPKSRIRHAIREYIKRYN